MSPFTVNLDGSLGLFIAVCWFSHTARHLLGPVYPPSVHFNTDCQHCISLESKIMSATTGFWAMEEPISSQTRSEVSTIWVYWCDRELSTNKICTACLEFGEASPAGGPTWHGAYDRRSTTESSESAAPNREFTKDGTGCWSRWFRERPKYPKQLTRERWPRRPQMHGFSARPTL